MKPSAVLTRLFREVVAEADRNPEFGEKLLSAVSAVVQPKAQPGPERPKITLKRPNRRASGPFDPFAVGRAEGLSALRARLGTLNLDQLRDIIAEHAMDGSRLALKWKAPERLIDLITTTVVGRTSKGDAFRETPVGLRGDDVMPKVGAKKPCPVPGCDGTATAAMVRTPDVHFVGEGSLLPGPVGPPQLKWVCDTCGAELHA